MKSILKTLKQMLTNNWALKLLSFAFAAIVWIAVINVNDPTIIDTITNVPIQIVNEEAITGNNQIYTVESRKYVNVTVSGRRSLVRDLTAASFEAEASLGEMSLTNSVPVVVSFKNKGLEGKVTISNQSVAQISVHVENIETKTYDVESNIVGQLPKNYELEDVSLSRNKIDITAPESVHATIARLTVNVDISDITADFSDRYRIHVLGNNGQELNMDDMTLSNKNAKVSVKIWKLKTVPIVVEMKGSPAAGYEVQSVKTDPEKITLAGPVSVINKIEEVHISGDDVDITGIHSDVQQTLKLTDYLTSGVEVRGNTEVNISIQVEGNIARQFTFRPEDIVIRNVPTGMVAEILSESVTVDVYGKERYFEGITVDNLQASIDLGGTDTGKNTVELNVTLPQGLALSNIARVRVRLSEEKSE